jgi:DNA-binding MarR family transcriptional regulator
MPPKGLFNKVKNRMTRRRYVVSTIRKGENLFETAIFEANFFYFPRNLKNPALTVETHTRDDAWDTHFKLTGRLTLEYPERLFQEYREDAKITN